MKKTTSLALMVVFLVPLLLNISCTKKPESLKYRFNYINPITEENELIDDDINKNDIFTSWDGTPIIRVVNENKNQDGENIKYELFKNYDSETTQFNTIKFNSISDVDDGYRYTIYTMTSTSDGGYVFLLHEYKINTDNYLKLCVKKVDTNGKSIFKSYDIFSANGLSNDLSTSDQIITDSDGYIYFLNPYRSILNVLSPNGEYLFMLQPPDDKGNPYNTKLVRTEDGRVMLCYYNQSERAYLTRNINISGESYENPVKISETNLNKPFFGAGYYVYYYDSIGFYGVNQGEKPVLLFDWLDVGLSKDLINDIIIRSAEEIFVKMTDPANGGVKYGRIIKTAEVEDENETVLRIAVDKESAGASLTKILQYIAAFNREESGCRVELVSYSDGGEGGLSANQKLAQDIAAGNSPDLVLFGYPSDITYELLAKSDIFLDIYDLMDNDADYKRESFLPCVTKPFETTEGKLKRLTINYTFSTVLAKKSIVGDREGWTLDDMVKLNESLADDQYLVSVSGSDTQLAAAQNLLSRLLPYMIDEFIDYDAGICNFNGLTDLLELCKNAKILNIRGIPPTMTRDGKVLLNFSGIYGISTYMVGRYVTFDGEDVTNIGYPSFGNENNGTVIAPIISVAVAKDCADPKMAWELIKFIIGSQERDWESVKTSAEFIGQNYLPCTYNGVNTMLELCQNFQYVISGAYQTDPVTKEEFYSYMIATENIPEEGAEIGKTHTDGTVVRVSDADKAVLHALFENTEKVYVSDAGTVAIILEEASAYFSGAKPLDETVKLIQNRIETRINE